MNQLYDLMAASLLQGDDIKVSLLDSHGLVIRSAIGKWSPKGESKTKGVLIAHFPAVESGFTAYSVRYTLPGGFTQDVDINKTTTNGADITLNQSVQFNDS